jgi:hypothetical protein
MIISFVVRRNMKSWFARFNLYFMAAILIAGCTTSKNDPHKSADKNSNSKKEQATVRLYLEATPDGSGGNGVVLVTKQKIPVHVAREEFLNEGDIHHAELVATPGGFAISLNFSDHGLLQLDMVTTSNKGRHIAVLVQFPESRWVAAPIITKRISNGAFVFTPDLTLEEAQRVVRGLNNVAEKARKQTLF